MYKVQHNESRTERARVVECGVELAKELASFKASTDCLFAWHLSLSIGVVGSITTRAGDPTLPFVEQLVVISEQLTQLIWLAAWLAPS